MEVNNTMNEAMNELLQSLFEAEVLTQETRDTLAETFNSELASAAEEAREAAEADVRAELTESFIKDKERLVEALDAKINDMASEEFSELRESIEAYEDQEAAYAQKLVEAKAAMAVELQEDMNVLVDKMDKFFEIKLTEEMDELREDIKQARENDLGRRIFEAVKDEYQNEYHDSDEAKASYAELETRLAEGQEALEDAETRYAELERILKLDEVLAPLEGQQREVMEAVLENVPTGRLVEGYKKFLPRVIRDANDDTSEKEDDTVLSEGAEEVNETITLESVNLINGDRPSDVIDDQTDGELTEAFDAELQKMLRQAGMQ